MGRAYFYKTLHASLFRKGLLNELKFGWIHLTALESTKWVRQIWRSDPPSPPPPPPPHLFNPEFSLGPKCTCPAFNTIFNFKLESQSPTPGHSLLVGGGRGMLIFSPSPLQTQPVVSLQTQPVVSLQTQPVV
jgi:hypothetical protein